MSFLDRWFRAHGVPADEISSAVEAARVRAERLPFPIRSIYGAVEKLVDRAPALLQRTLRSSDELDADAFDDFERSLQHHPLIPVRALYSLVRFPAYDAAYPDDWSGEAPSHPLHALQDRLRLGRAHGRSFDVIVIGSGAGGAPLAWALSEAGFEVAIVEAGSICTAESTGDAVENHYLGQGLTAATPLGGMVLAMAGEAVGGTTVINSGTSLPPRQDCLRRWDRMLGTDFAGGALQPYVRAASQLIGVTVPDRSLLDASAGIVEQGLAALGRDGAYVLPRNAPRCRGEGRCCFGCPSGAKLSTDRSFLPQAVEHGAVLLSETRALEIRERANGVEVFVEGPAGKQLLRGRHVVVAAGALSTPSLIRGSRLGTEWRQAGNHLSIHPACKVFGLMPEPLPHGGIPQGLGYKAPELPRLTFEGAHIPAGMGAPMISAAGARHRWWMERYDRLANFGMMCRDRNTGRVRRIGSLRQIDYRLHPDDARDLAAGVLLVGEALFAAGAERLLMPVLGMEPEVASLDELRKLRPEDIDASNLVTCGFHAQGTAGMGRVVDNDLRIKGCDRSWVCDASVMPDSPGVNPQVTIMALSLRCAERLIEELGGSPRSRSRFLEGLASAKTNDAPMAAYAAAGG